MHVADLSLTSFRNYADLRLELPARLILVVGDNAQGKTNLLEAIYMLATTRSFRADSERELIDWRTWEDSLTAARVVALVKKKNEELELEIALQVVKPPLPPQAQPPPDVADSERSALQKRYKVNGIVRRASDVIGKVNVVLFGPEDIALVGGSPSFRRRYVDILCSQIDPRYLRSLQLYQRVLLQRNNLLRLIQEGRAVPGELLYWNEKLVESGSYLISRRQAVLKDLAATAAAVHSDLTSAAETLSVQYIASVNGIPESGEGIPELLESALSRNEKRDTLSGTTSVGPHRDDLRFIVNSKNMAAYGSRGQQRTVVLSLKLAESQVIQSRMGDSPIVLLDDVLSELDSRRRSQVLGYIAPFNQVMITTTGAESFESELAGKAAVLQVAAGYARSIA